MENHCQCHPQPSPWTPPEFGPRMPPECGKEGGSEPAPLLGRPLDSQSSDAGPSGVQTPWDDQTPP